LLLFAAKEGYLAEWAEKGELRRMEENFIAGARANFSELKKLVWEAKDLTPELEEEFRKVIKSLVI